MRFRVNYRLGQLRSARKSGTLPDLETLAASDDRQVYGPRHRAYYSLARYLLLYLESRNTLKQFIDTLRSKPATADWQLEVLRRFIDFEAFLAWSDTLQID
jgi:hypothetical protein